MTAGLAPAPAPIPVPTLAGPVTQLHVVRSEWAKLRGLRSTWYCALTAVLLIVGLGAVIAAAGSTYQTAHLSPAKAMSISLLGVILAQLIIGVLSVLAFSGEYGTGMIRGTLAAVPSRLPVLWAKLIAMGGLVLSVTLVSAALEFFVVTAIQSARGAPLITLTDPGVLRVMVGSSLYLLVVAVIGLALGALVRKTAAGLAVFAAVFFVAPIIVGLLPHSIAGVARYLPSNAGGVLWGSTWAPAHPLSPWPGFAVLCGYAVVLIGLGAWQLRRRDA